MEQTKSASWADRWSAVVRRNIAFVRGERGLSARQLAERCAAHGYPIARSTIAGIEAGVRRHVAAHELAVIARALGVPPVRLLYDVHDGDTLVEVLPGVEVFPVEGVEWFSGRVRITDGGMTAELDGDDMGLSLARHEFEMQRRAAQAAAHIQRGRDQLADVEAGIVSPGDDPESAGDRARSMIENGERALDRAAEGVWQARRKMQERGMVLPPLHPSIHEAVGPLPPPDRDV